MNALAFEVEKLRPAAVESHVKQVAQRLGCSTAGTQRALQVAARALRHGATAHRAIQAGLNAAIEDGEVLRRIRACAPNPHKPDRFARETVIDALGFLGLLAIDLLAIAYVWFRLGAL